MTVHSNWRDDAACHDADRDLFFPVGTTGPALRQIDEAKRICRVGPGADSVPGLGAGPRSHRWCVGRDHSGRAARHPAPRLKGDNQRGMTMETVTPAGPRPVEPGAPDRRAEQHQGHDGHASDRRRDDVGDQDADGDRLLPEHGQRPRRSWARTRRRRRWRSRSPARGEGGVRVTAGMIALVAWIPASAMSSFLRPNRSAAGSARIASAAPPGEAPDTRYP